MKLWVIIILGFGYVWTGCRSVQPVSSVQNTEMKKDSTRLQTTTEKRDSSYKETVEPVTIKGGKVDIGFSKKQFDSLLAVISFLQKLPPELRTIYKVDPETKQQLKIFMDSVGNIHFQCIQEAQTYWQKYIHEHTEKEKLQTQLTEANSKIESSDRETVEAKKGFWDSIDWKAKLLIWFISFGIFYAIVQYALSYVKKLTWVTGLLKIFKLKK